MPIQKPLFTEDQLLVAQLTGKLPLMLTTRQTAAVLGVKPHDIKAFIRAAVLRPLGVPLSEGDGYFDREAVLGLAGNQAALAKARRIMKENWSNHNENGTTNDSCHAFHGNPQNRTEINIPDHIIRKVEDKIVETCLKAQSLFGRPFELPTIRWDLRGRCAGRAYARDNQIRLNPVLLAENVEHFITQIVPHEIAHLVNRVLNGFQVKPHGPEWKTIMRSFGLPPDRCHNYDVTNAKVRKQRRYILYCACGTHNIGLTTQNRINRGAVYLCRRCNAALSAHHSSNQTIMIQKSAPESTP